jgi:hypothetical protein
VRRTLIGVGLVTTVAIAVAPAAMARPPYMAAFQKQYNITAESNIGKARCGVCHTDGSKPAAGWTRFGKDLAVGLGKRRAMPEEVVAALGKVENEMVGMEKYVDRIKADKLPSGD